jgi:hypothetical protein
LHLVVGLWDAQGDLNKSKERIGSGAAVVATLAAAQETIHVLIEQLEPRSEKLAQPECVPAIAAGV